MAWDNYDIRVDYTSEDGDFQIVEGDFNGEHRYGMRWTHWNYGAPLVIPPLFDDDIESIIQSYNDGDYDDEDYDEDDEDEDGDDDEEDDDED